MSEHQPTESADQALVARRTALKAALGGVATAAVLTAPRVEGFSLVPDYAAAATVTTTAVLDKDPNGTIANRCVANNGRVGCTLAALANQAPNRCSNAGRGSVVFTSNGTTISVTITLSSGPSIAGRSIHILQSNGSACTSSVSAGTWALTPQNGPQTFSVPIVGGATVFAVHIPASGGGGTDIYSSFQVSLVA